MAEVSRTARVIQNAKVALFFYCINLILQFFSRKIFLDYLGAELLGLNTTAQNLLQFLNLAESGIGAAVAFALYKPLSQKNRQEIIDIVSLQGWFYRWVGLFVIAGSIVLMAFFPWIFAKADVPLIYAYGTFIAFLISALLGYFVNYKMIVLSADQKEYKITIETQSIKVIKVFIQMLAIWKLPHGYVWWMMLEALSALITSVRLTYCIKSEYPWLKSEISRGNSLKVKYSFLLTKTKQLFFHKIGSYVLGQTTPLVVYAFSSLSVVAIYGNYVMIMMGCLLLTDAFFRGSNASVGDLVAEGNQELIKTVFWEIYTARIMFAGFMSFGLYSLSADFMQFWVGSSYVLPTTPCALLIGIYFIQMSRTCDIFIGAYGLFSDIWAPIIESMLNLSLSIVLGYFYGLSGIFLGVLLSQIIVVNSWKAIFLYKKGFKENIFEFVLCYTKKIILLGLVFFFVELLMDNVLLLKNTGNKVAELFSSMAGLIIFLIVELVLFFLFDSSCRSAVLRILKFIKKN